ncbi:MAG: phosphocholine cytidylyltransferase family protein [Gammaproteobacteria bacterium]|nr:phosphocholine cytidylyltransferase family protein [Gammaproteobacteria bacterium]
MTHSQYRASTRAILLSAGQGRRLLPLTAETPKCLLPVAGKPIIQWQVDALLAAGIGEIAIVTGYRPDKVEGLIRERYAGQRITPVFNPFFDVSDNLASCWMAREFMSGDFLLMNGDVILNHDVVNRVLSSPRAPIVLTVDYKRSYDDDDMKVQLEDSLVRHVSKKLAPERVDAESIGLLYFRDQGPALFRSAVEHALRHPQGLRQWYLSVVDHLASQSLVSACPVDGLRWMELDFPADIAAAEARFGEHAAAASRPGQSVQNPSPLQEP